MSDQPRAGNAAGSNLAMCPSKPKTNTTLPGNPKKSSMEKYQKLNFVSDYRCNKVEFTVSLSEAAEKPANQIQPGAALSAKHDAARWPQLVHGLGGGGGYRLVVGRGRHNSKVQRDRWVRGGAATSVRQSGINRRHAAAAQ